MSWFVDLTADLVLERVREGRVARAERLLADCTVDDMREIRRQLIMAAAVVGRVKSDREAEEADQ